MENYQDITSTIAYGYGEELPSLLVEDLFRSALQLDWCQYFEFAAKNPYRCGRMNFTEFWQSKNLTHFLVEL